MRFEGGSVQYCYLVRHRNHIVTFDDLYQSIRLLGRIFEKRRAAEALIGEIQADLDHTAAKVAPIPDAKRQRVMRLMGRDSVMTPGDDSFQNEMIRRAGGIAPKLGKPGDIVEVTLDEWRAFNPQVLYGCGDLIDDYEGIRGHEEYRIELALLYLVTLDRASGELVALEGEVREGGLDELDARRLRLLVATLCLPAAGWGHASDPDALRAAARAIERGLDRELAPERLAFLYMPYMHSESPVIHEVALKLFRSNGIEGSYEYEVRHKEIIDKFGRYPHRNAVLGRKSTAAEIEFLKQPGSGF